MSFIQASIVVVFAALGACTTPVVERSSASHRIDGPPGYTVFWDLPETGRYWVPKGAAVDQVVDAGGKCGAQLDGGMSHHIPVPPAYGWFVFRFVGPVSDGAKTCVIQRLKAVPALTVYEKKH